jgi:hypothetical protein
VNTIDTVTEAPDCYGAGRGGQGSTTVSWATLGTAEVGCTFLCHEPQIAVQ